MLLAVVILAFAFYFDSPLSGFVQPHNFSSYKHTSRLLSSLT